MKEIKNIIALDCGNSSFRVVCGKFNGEKITTEVISQTKNEMINVLGYYYWDFLTIYSTFISSLKEVIKQGKKIDSIGICTWGVDFSLFDKNGNMLLNPLSYRNTIGEEYLNKLSAEKQKEMFLETGILCDKINSAYLLSGIKNNMPEIYNISDRLLMIPDLINFMLTGVMQNEPSELSTTQLMSSKTIKISEKMCSEFGFSEELFSKIGTHGECIGILKADIKKILEIDYDIPVICVPSHDTAAAVMAIPAAEENFAFISSGTWSLIGTELDEPKINEDVLNAKLTNEVGAFGKITLLKNSAGMFIIQKLKKEYDELTGKNNSWDYLDELADEYEGQMPLFNVNNTRFFNPASMNKEIQSYLIETGQINGEISFGGIIKAVHESMACCYAETISEIEKICGKTFESIYIVGGGSKNIALNKLTSAKTEKKVIACSKESTSLGCIATQIKYFESSYTLSEIRKIIKNSIDYKEYSEKADNSDLILKYKKLT